MYRKGFYGLLETGKNCYYRMPERPSMDWRRLMNCTVIRFMCVLQRNGIQTDDGNSCVIIDDTALEKSGKFMEHITKVFDHVKRNYVPGYKLLLCAFFDGKSTLPFDFSLHEEPGRKGDGGIGKRQLRRRFSIHREKDNSDY